MLSHNVVPFMAMLQPHVVSRVANTANAFRNNVPKVSEVSPGLCLCHCCHTAQPSRPSITRICSIVERQGFKVPRLGFLLCTSSWAEWRSGAAVSRASGYWQDSKATTFLSQKSLDISGTQALGAIHMYVWYACIIYIYIIYTYIILHNNIMLNAWHVCGLPSTVDFEAPTTVLTSCLIPLPWDANKKCSACSKGVGVLAAASALIKTYTDIRLVSASYHLI